MFKLFRLLKPYRPQVAIVMVLALAQSLVFLLLPLVLRETALSPADELRA